MGKIIVPRHIIYRCDFCGREIQAHWVNPIVRTFLFSVVDDKPRKKRKLCMCETCCDAFKSYVANHTIGDEFV